MRCTSIRTWLKPQLGHLPLERLNAGHIEELNPASGVELDSVESRERQRWTPAQAAQFITATASEPMGLMFRVAVLRGCRRGELCGFRWADAELDKPYRDPATGQERIGAVLTVERPIVELGGKLRESKAKMRAGNRRVFLDHDTAKLVREHRKAQLKVRLKAGTAWADNDLVFCQDDGQPWHPDHVSKRFKKLAAQAGVPVVTLHQGGRHIGNSLMQDAGVDQELRMREVGHADKSVNDRYTRPLEQAHLAASEQTAALARKAGKAS
jgi:integrase